METILSSAFAAALELLESRASEQSFLELLEQVYGATGSDDAAFAAAAGSLQQLLSSGGELGIQVKTLDSADMNGAMGAYSSTGLDGVPVIYINTSLLSEGSDPELLQRVLLEEIGHHFDILLNGSIDTTGDEGELFADLISSGDELSAEEQSLKSITVNRVTNSIDTSSTDKTVSNASGSGGIIFTGTLTRTGSSRNVLSLHRRSAGTSGAWGTAITSLPANTFPSNGYYNFSLTDSSVTEGSWDYLISSTITPASTTTSNFAGVTVDSTATNAPTITSITDDVGTITGTLTSGGRTDDTNLTVKVTLPTTGTAAVAGDRIQLYNSSTALGTAYTLLAGDITNGFANVATGTLTNGTTYTINAKVIDIAGNASTASGNFTTTVDTTAPTVSSIAYGTNDGNLAAGESITLLVTFSENVNVTGTPTLALNSGGTASYSSGTGTNQLTFTYTPASPQTTTDLATTASAFSGTITDAAGNAVVASGFNSVNPAGTVAVDTTPPTGSLTLTPPTDNGIQGDGIAIGGTFSIGDLEQGNGWQYSINSGSTWTTGSGTTFSAYGSFASNQVQVRQVDAAGNAGPATAYGSAITVIDSSTLSPAEITITLVGGSDNTVSSASGDQVVTGTTSLANSEISIWAGSTQLGTTTADASGNFSYTLTAANLTTLGADGTKTISAIDTYGGSSTPYDFTLAMDPVCFMAGTLISTPAGATPIEQLQPGDLVLTPEGPVAVKFVGRSTHSIAALKHLNKLPVRIMAGALGGHGPSCDTYLTPNHALALLGCLVEAGTLENGRTITRYQEWWASPSITYLTVELEQHSLIWANGLLAESYYASASGDGDGFTRQVWDNLADYLALYGEENTMDELAMPRLVFSRQLPAEIRALAGIDSFTLYAAGAISTTTPAVANLELHLV